MFIIMGTYQGKTEEIDEFDTRAEAEQMLSEYRMAFGADWALWVIDAAAKIPEPTDQELHEGALEGYAGEYGHGE
jgi:hypothetical protein